MRALICTLFMLFICVMPVQVHAQADYTSFAQIPILHEGRIKPIDSFARHYLKVFSGKEHLKEQSASAWIADVIFRQPETLKRPLFRIKHPEIITLLKLKKQRHGLYSFVDIFSSFIEHVEMLENLYKQPEDNLSQAQFQLLELHAKIQIYMNLISTFDKNPATLFRIIPPQWDTTTDDWFSPWEMVQQGQGSPASALYLNMWGGLAQAYKARDVATWNTTSKQIFEHITKSPNISGNMLKLEVINNKFALFQKSLILYILALAGLFSYILLKKQPLYLIAKFSVIGGIVCHTTGIIMRMVIMSRPPVTSLYDSVLFVGLIAVLLGLFLEKSRKDGLGIFIAGFAGALLQFIGLKYAMDGDTMGMLVAVLDTNFWLSTHVVTITIGYGCALIAGMMAHFYLIRRAVKPNNDLFLSQLDKNIKAVALIALFFSTLGTILGGIWADQSWGRFWGWDPKENGALLIVLWLIWLLHSRVAGQLKTLGFMTGMVLTTTIVAIAWFGVNLLNIGLHSYGFTQHIAFNLGLFCGLEFLFAASLFCFIKWRMLCD